MKLYLVEGSSGFFRLVRAETPDRAYEIFRKRRREVLYYVWEVDLSQPDKEGFVEIGDILLEKNELEIPDEEFMG